MEIVVCVKPVPDPETRLRSSAEGTTLDIEAVKFVLTGYDESAVEQALLLKEATPGSKVHVVSAGPPPRTEEVLRASLALGCDTATWVETPPGVGTDPIAAARALGRVVSALPHDLVLVGKQALDDEAGVVGAALAEILGVPDFSAVVDLRWDAGAARLRFQRSTDLGDETWEAPVPCVVALQQAWNDPRTAKLPAILKSRKQPISKAAADPIPPGAGTSRPAKFELPPPRTGAKLIEFKTPEEAAQKLVKVLQEEAKVFP
jgi:electron transfer flavoprotein beta subunit